MLERAMHTSPEYEDAAIAYLVKRARKVRMRVGLATALAGVVAGAGGAWTALEFTGGMPGGLFALIAVVPLAACGYAGLRLAKTIIRTRGRTWAADAARRFSVDAAELRMYLRHM